MSLAVESVLCSEPNQNRCGSVGAQNVEILSQEPDGRGGSQRGRSNIRSFPVLLLVRLNTDFRS
jgi:hypothetical protein